MNPFFYFGHLSHNGPTMEGYKDTWRRKIQFGNGNIKTKGNGVLTGVEYVHDVDAG